MIVAAMGNHLDVVKILLQENANVEHKDVYYLTALSHAASVSGAYKICELLIGHGALVNIAYGYGL